MDLRLMFNEVAVEYDRLRPTYVSELYSDLIAYSGINQDFCVLEIGIGTGQATLPILNTGCKLTAVELGDKLTAYTREKYADYKNLEVKNVAFENYDCNEESLNMIYSASAFHWIPEEIGYTKVYRLLKSGGVFARFANLPNPHKATEAPLNEAIWKLYEKYIPNNPRGPQPEYSEENCKKTAYIAEKYGFANINYKIYHRTRIFTAEEYAALTCTYHNHRAIGEENLRLFAEGMIEAINSYGGKIIIHDTIDLQLARKP